MWGFVPVLPASGTLAASGHLMCWYIFVWWSDCLKDFSPSKICLPYLKLMQQLQVANVFISLQKNEIQAQASQFQRLHWGCQPQLQHKVFSPGLILMSLLILKIQINARHALPSSAGEKLSKLNAPCLAINLGQNHNAPLFFMPELQLGKVENGSLSAAPFESSISYEDWYIEFKDLIIMSFSNRQRAKPSVQVESEANWAA